jgi:tRNA nucleotidyltransferase/poly(A) polymerase
MAMDLNHNVIDPFEGEFDLDFRTVRFVGNPSDRILEDPNRMLRACRFVAKLNGSLDKDALRAITRHRGYMQYISPERIRLEVFKAMACKRASKFFNTMRDCGLLDFVFPSLSACFSHTGGNYHPETVYDHAMLTGDAISTRCPLTKLAGYLHDVGKPVTYDKTTGQFLDHETIGATLVKNEMMLLKFSTDEINMVTGLIQMHMKTATVLTDKSVRRLLRKFSELGVYYRDYLRLYIADRNSNTGIPHMSTYDIRHLIDTVEDQMSIEIGATKVTDLKVSGYDVMEICKLQSGPMIGQILNHLLDMVIIDPSLNTQENLIQMLQTY